MIWVKAFIRCALCKAVVLKNSRGQYKEQCIGHSIVGHAEASQ